MNPEIEDSPMKIKAETVLWSWTAPDDSVALLVEDKVDPVGIRLFWRRSAGRIEPSYRLHPWEAELLRQLLKERASKGVTVNEKPNGQLALFGDPA